MILNALPDGSGNETLNRTTFSGLPNGDARRLGEKSDDEGRTRTTFDFTYTKK